MSRGGQVWKMGQISKLALSLMKRMFSHHIKKVKASWYSVLAWRKYSFTDSSVTPRHRISMEMQLLGPWTRDNKDPGETLGRLLFLVYVDIPTRQITCPLDRLRLMYF